MLNILIGKAKTGKSKYLMDMMDKDVTLDKEVIFFVPSQMRMLAEEKYMNIQNKEGIIGINFTTISSYISSYLKSNNLVKDDKYLSNTDKKIILSKIIEENDDIFRLFKKSKNHSGFLNSVKIYLDLLKKGEITKENIENLDESKNILLRNKLDEIYSIYEKYVEEVSDKYIDSIDEVDIFINNYINENKKISLFFDSYNNFSKSELKFIDFMLKCGNCVTIALSCNITDLIEDTQDIDDINYISNRISEDETIFSEYNLTYINLLKIAKKNNINYNIVPFLYNSISPLKNDIYELNNRLFLNNINEKRKLDIQNLNINFASNIFEEIESIAKQISQNVKSGDKYSDFAVFTSNLDEYENIIKNVFKNYNISFFIDQGEKISSSIIYKYIMCIFEIAVYNLNYSNLMRLLRLNMLGVAAEDISYLENYLLEYGLNDEFKMTRKINEDKDSNYDLERIKSIKYETIDKIILLKQKLKNAITSEEIKEILYNHLKEDGILDNLNEKTRDLEKNEKAYIRYIGSLNYLSYNKVIEVIESISKIYKNKKISVKKYYDIFKNATSDITVKTVPKGINEVEILDINVSKTSPKKYIIFVGVNEGKMPIIPSQDVFFSDKELLLLKSEANISIKEDTVSKSLLAKYNIYEALNLAQNQVSIYYLGSDNNGKSLRKSEIISDILDFTNIKIEDVSEKKYSVISEKELLLDLNQDIREDNINEKTIATLKYLKENSKYSEVITYIRNSDSISKETIDKIYSMQIVDSSISRLETFKKCPFSYFVKYILKVDERKKYEITKIDLGSFMHSCLENFSNYLLNNSISWKDILNDDKYFLVLNEIIEKNLESSLYRYKDNVKYDILKRKLNSAMKNAVITIAKSFVQSEFQPFAYELEFSDKSKYLPIEVKLSDNKVMHLRGKIDRVDIAKINDTIYTRIVDYKSSDRNLSIDDVKEGISLQLITYISAFINSSSETIKPAGVMYFNLSDKLTKLSEYESDQTKISESIAKSLRMKGIFLKDVEIISAMDKKIETQERLIDVSMKTVKSETSSKSLLSDEEFENICKDIKEILKQIGKELIIDGKTEIKPNKKADPCKYCKYSHICRKNNMC